MNKALVYAVTAISLGIVMMLLPTWFFLEGDVHPQLSYALTRLASGQTPLIEYQERDLSDPISSREVGILGVSFVAASIVYMLFRRTPRQNRIWLPHRRY